MPCLVPAAAGGAGGGSVSIMRTIAINGRYLSQRVTGVQRVAIELVSALDAEIATGRIPLGDTRVVLAAPRGAPLPALRAIETAHIGRLTGHAWEQLEFPWLCRGALQVSLCGAAPLLAPGHVVTFHDTAVFAAPQSFTTAFRLWYRTLFRVQGRLASTVVTVSEFSRGELTRYCSIAREKLRIVPPAAGHLAEVAPDPAILGRLGVRPGGYALAVGSLHPNKNFAAVEAAAAALAPAPFQFVVVGGETHSVFRRPVGHSADVIFAGRVSDRELSALYRGAFCFIAPSRYEGFGIPPLEAMHCGCPVLAADAAATPETCADAALYFHPDQPAALAHLLLELFSNSALQAMLRRRGFERVRAFTWQQSAQGLWSVIASAGRLPATPALRTGEDPCLL